MKEGPILLRILTPLPLSLLLHLQHGQPHKVESDALLSISQRYIKSGLMCNSASTEGFEPHVNYSLISCSSGLIFKINC